MTTRTLVLAAAICSAALSACVVAPARPYAYESGGIVTDVAPPAPYVETIPPPPFLGALWIGGYWGFSGGRHVWVPGRYERPRPGYHWEPNHWVQHGGRWHLEGGAWRR